MKAAVCFFGLLCGLLLSRPASGVLATDCTRWAASTGSDANSGLTALLPKTFTGSQAVSVPGDVICLKGGTYNIGATVYLTHNGTSGAWITYKAYGDSPVILLWTGGGAAPDMNMLHFFNGGPTFTAAIKFIEIRGLEFDGQNLAANALKCAYSHHLRFIGNIIRNIGAAGVATKFCDYITTGGNTFSHIGYNQGFSSAVSYNSQQWTDAVAGFHSYVVNNIVSGTFDGSTFHSDGSGIIMDLSDDTTNPASANTPPVLIANNVVFENGGRCIHTLIVSNIWVVNNTCYKDELDLTQNVHGEYTANDAKNGYFVNNIAYAWNSRPPYELLNGGSTNAFYKNLRFGGTNNFTYTDETQFITGDPLFSVPPTVHPTNGCQYATAPLPSDLGSALILQTGSPAINGGRDPTTIAGLTPEIIAGLNAYVLHDITGRVRPRNGQWDLGAYVYRGCP